MRDLLIEMGACYEFVEWVGYKSLEEAWATCPYGDWLLWFAAKRNIDRKTLVFAACQCARLSLQHEKDELKVIKVIEAWCNGLAPIKEVKDAAKTAKVYVTSYTAHAVFSSIINVSYAACSIINVPVLEVAEIIRKHIPFELIK